MSTKKRVSESTLATALKEGALLHRARDSSIATEWFFDITLEELLVGVTPEIVRKGEYRDDFFGPPQGREVW
jgi:hypothetical protein